MCHISCPTHYYYPDNSTGYYNRYPYPWGAIIPPPSSCPCCGRWDDCGRPVNVQPDYVPPYPITTVTISSTDMPPFSLRYSGTDEGGDPPP